MIPGRPGRVGVNVHFRAISCRCHRRIVSGVTMVATCRKTRRPSRRPVAARRRRWSSVSRRRRPFTCSWRIRFSSTRYSITCCWWRLTHPASVTSSTRKGWRSAFIGRSYRALRPDRYREGLDRIFGHYGVAWRCWQTDQNCSASKNPLLGSASVSRSIRPSHAQARSRPRSLTALTSRSPA
jgi:hypothetical protein